MSHSSGALRLANPPMLVISNVRLIEYVKSIILDMCYNSVSDSGLISENRRKMFIFYLFQKFN